MHVSDAIIPTAEATFAPPPLPPPAQATDEDLRLLGEFLAREFGFDEIAACVEEPSYYRERVGEDICTLERAVVLRLIVMDLCRTKAGRYPFLVMNRDRELARDVLRDFAREEVRDTPTNRARRAALMKKLPDRVNSGVLAVWEDGEREPAFDRARARAEFERRMERERAEEDEYGGLAAPPAFLAFLLLLLAAAGALAWDARRTVSQWGTR